MDWFIPVAIVVGLLILWIWYRVKFKRIVTNCVTLITGAPKTGKDELQNDLAPTAYKRAHRIWWIRTHIFRRKEEEPLFYCNHKFGFNGWRRYGSHPLDKNIRFITKELCLREKRLAEHSVCSITEGTLVADAMLGKDDRKLDTTTIGIELTLFFKLYGHSCGGQLFLNSQNVLDLHYSIKRVCSSFLFIQKRVTPWWLFGLFDVLYVREMINSDLGAINNFQSDVDDTMKIYAIFRPKCLKLYDYREFRKFTADLPVENETYSEDKGLVSFNPLYVKMADKRHKEEDKK